MRLVRAQFRGEAGERVYTEAEQAAILAAFVNLEDEPFQFKEGKVDRWYQALFWDLDQFPLEHIAELNNIKPVKLNVKISEVFDIRPNVVYNEHVKVVMPGIGLLQFDHVTVVYDTCTNELHSYLKQGWRIVAVCPQPDQRRPDYVLGRVGPEE